MYVPNDVLHLIRLKKRNWDYGGLKMPVTLCHASKIQKYEKFGLQVAPN